MFYLARRSVQFLSQAWIMLLICLMYCGALFFIATHGGSAAVGHITSRVAHLFIGLLLFAEYLSLRALYAHGYLQWGRMWGYAVPALVLIFIYGVGAAVGSNMANVYTFDDIVHFFLSGDVVLRIICLLLSGYYICNIFRLPHRLVRSMQLPSDLIAYGALLGFVSLFFVFITIKFNWTLVCIYMFLFTFGQYVLVFPHIAPYGVGHVISQFSPGRETPNERGDYAVRSRRLQ